MNIITRPETKQDFNTIDELVENSFKYGTEYSDGKIEVELVHEIRSKKYYIPQLSFVAESDGKIVGYFMLSHFPFAKTIEGFDFDKTAVKTDSLMLTPVAVHIDFLHKGIGSEMIKQGLKKAKAMGYKSVIVEGNPAFYNTLGFVSSFKLNILPAQHTLLPAPECLMAQELEQGALKGENYVDYSMYQTIYHP